MGLVGFGSVGQVEVCLDRSRSDDRLFFWPSPPPLALGTIHRHSSMSIVDELIFGLVLLRQDRFLFFPGEQIFLSLCEGEGRTVSQGGRVLNYHHLHHYGHYCQAVSHL